MAYPLDLYVLVADLDQRQTLEALLQHRTQSLQIRPVQFEIAKHPHRDSGCFKTSPALLQTLQTQAAHALVILDREGSGAENLSVGEIAGDLDGRLAESGWGDRARTIVIDPEIEIWVWSQSPHVAQVLGWSGVSPGLRQWLTESGYLTANQTKPARPKEALHAALRKTGIKPSAALFSNLARKVGLELCADPSFGHLGNTLRSWFGMTQPGVPPA